MSQLQTQKYAALTIGNQGDAWSSTSGNKITDVADANDSDYIYLDSDQIPESVYVIMQLGVYQQISPIYDLPEEPPKLVIPLIKSLAPDGQPWTIQKWNDTVGIVVHSGHEFPQSYTFEQEEISGDVVQGGIELTVNFGTDGLDGIRIKGLKFVKVRKW